MKILRVITRNIMCYSNNTIDINFDEEPAIWELLGGNGKGKSTIIKIIKLGIYGKTDGLTMSEIANDVNGNGYIEVHFESKGVFNKIIRTFTPHSTSLYENNSAVATDKGGKPALEKYITEQVVDIPYYVFDNVLNLDLGTFKSFLTMKPEDARKIRDRIFSFYVLNTMTEMLKTGISVITKNIDTINISIANINENIEGSNRSYEEAKSKLSDNKDQQIAIYTEQLKEQQEKLDEYAKQKTTIQNLLTEYQNDMTAIQWLMMKQEFEKIEADIAQFDVTLGQLDINKNKHKDDLILYENNIKLIENKKKEEEIVIAQQELTNTVQLIEDGNIKKNELSDAISEVRNNLETEKVKIQTIRDIEYMLSVKTYVAEQIALKEELNLQIKQLVESDADYATKVEKVNDALLKYSDSKNICTRRLAAYDKGTCPECGTNLADDIHAGKRDEYQSELDTAITKHKEISDLKIKVVEGRKQVNTKKEEAEKKLAETIQSIKSKGNELAVYKCTEVCTVLKNKIIGDMVAVVKGLTLTLTDITEIITNLKPVTVADEQTLRLLEKTVVDNENNLTDTNQKIQQLNFDKVKFETKISTINSSISTVVDEQISIGKNQEELNKLVNDVRTSINLLDNDIISSKSSKISASNRLQEISIRMKSMPIPENKKNLTIESKDTIATKISEYTESVKNINERVGEQQQEVNKINANIDALNSLSNIEAQLTHLKSIIDGHKDQLIKKNEEYEAARQSLRYHAVLEYTISDSGIKAFILRDIVPAINNEIASILSTLDVPLNVMFDDEFQPTVTRMGKKANIKSISMGQKKMIDFAILTAVTKIIKMKYGNLNIIFYDEIFSSIEAVNRTILLDIIHDTFCKKLGVHVWIVNHGHLPSSYFKHILMVKSVNGFSELEIKDPNDIDYEEHVNSVLNAA